MTPRTTVLLFEELAHIPYGHHPTWVSQLARALAADGYDVRVLTRNGWLLEGDGQGVPGATATYRMTRRHRAAGRIGLEVGRVARRTLGERWGKPVVGVMDSMRQAVLVAASGIGCDGSTAANAP